MKSKVIELIYSVNNDLVDTIAKHDDPIDAWQTLQDQF
jgi:hypothetical protein